MYFYIFSLTLTFFFSSAFPNFPQSLLYKTFENASS
jgi:hypothetical protein